MSYIGNKPATSFETVQKQISTSNSGTTITLDKAVTSVQDILLTIDAVVQSYDNYSVSGTTLTVGGTLNNNRVEILYVGRTFGSIEPSADSVGSSTLKSNAVTTAKINNDAVTVDKLNLISTGSVPSLEAKGTSGVTEGYIQLNCAENSHGIKLKSPPHSAGASYTLTFPNNDGNANQFLQTNGSGVLSFADAGGGLVLTASGTTDGSASTITLTNAFSSTYQTYLLIINRLQTPTDESIFFQYGVGGIEDTSSDSIWTMLGMGNDGTELRHYSHQTSGGYDNFMRIGKNVDADSDVGLSCAIWLHNPNTTNTMKMYHGTVAQPYSTATNIAVYSVSGAKNKTTQFNSIRIGTENGATIRSGGTVRVYGVVNA